MYMYMKRYNICIYICVYTNVCMYTLKLSSFEGPQLPMGARHWSHLTEDINLHEYMGPD